MFDQTKKNLLLTGRPGVGKTTIMIRLAKVLGDRVDGFYTQELRERGRRTGFLLNSMDGREGLLAHTDLKQGPKVGRYTVNLDDLDAIGTASIERATRAGRIVFLDEIGKMELLSKSFKREVLRALDSPSRVVATVRERADDFCDSLKKRDDVSLIRVTDSNRGDLPKRIIETLDSPIG